MKREKIKPSGLSQYIILLKKDLIQEFRTKDMLVSMGVYALLVMIVFGVTLSFVHPGGASLEVSGGMLWAMIIFTSLMGLNRSFYRENKNGCLEGILLVPLDRGVVFLAKATSNLIFLLVVEVISVPLYWMLFSSSGEMSENVILLAIPIMIGSIGIAGVGTLLSTIATNTRGKDVMLAVLFVPIIFPLLYACVSATITLLIGDLSDVLITSLTLAFGYDVVMILVAWVLYDFVVSA